ncbi:putative vesicle-fusing ATPase [Helianthus annuus]|nr:putative vesicle-fusing ATPase [Helianthus annuus]KAJ0753840.1 putative vesicle-fusing ATPase [Helianthus annuus]KAJ0803497.1 putative vesicle-fusing ATPase [Helianthus annuus]
MEEDVEDEVPEIKAAHFEESMKFARRSVSDAAFVSTWHLLRLCSSLEVSGRSLGSLRLAVRPLVPVGWTLLLLLLVRLMMMIFITSFKARHSLS